MKRICSLLLLIISLIFLPAPMAKALTFDQYAWQKAVPVNINSAATAGYITTLTKEIQAIVNSQPLAPLSLHYADQPDEGYMVYQERGRIITTLALAYPYVSSTLQSQIKTYVRSAYASTGPEAFWNSQFKNPNEGAVRQLNQYTPDDIPTVLQLRNVSTLHVIYGAWLYGDRTGDWATVQNNWNAIKTYYQNNKSNNILYGSLDGIIAMLRLSRQFGDTTMQTTVQTDLINQFTAAQNPATMDARQKISYSYFYDATRKLEYFTGNPWMYLNISPEVARFISDTSAVKTDYLSRLTQFSAIYYPWWLYHVPAFTRWTGDEGIGGTPELMGMFFPAERWVKKTPPGALDEFLRSVPVGIGDSFWIESLISAIEANGQNCWTDVRDGTQTCDPAPSVSPQPSGLPTPTPVLTACQKADIDQNNFVDITDYSILTQNFFKPTLTNPRADINGDGLVDLADYSLLVASFLKSCP